jgi:hypothetical protein
LWRCEARKQPTQGSAQGASFERRRNTPTNSANRECSTRKRALFHGLKGERRAARMARERGARGTTAARVAHSTAGRTEDGRERSRRTFAGRGNGAKGE